MTTAARVRLRRAAARVCAAGLVIAFLGTLGFLPFAGRFLVRTDPLEPADAIFVLAGARVDRWLEGLELYREGKAPLVILSPGRLEKSEMALRARGVRFPTEAELARDAMQQLGVPVSAIRILPDNLDNTAQEAEALYRYMQDAASERPLHRIIVVTSAYHTRRTRFAFRRQFTESSVRIMIHASRFDEADPPRWWHQRSDIRFVTSELQKLLLYGFGLEG